MLGPIMLAEVVEGRWRPGIGDPTVIGWVTVVAYLVAALCASGPPGASPGPTMCTRIGRRRSGWCSALLVGLGINKQLDLQTLVTQIGRDVIWSLGLYQQRREFQVGFILAVALICVAAVAAFFWFARRSLRYRWLALVGTVFIFGFVVVRAASFHHIDAFLGADRRDEVELGPRAGRDFRCHRGRVPHICEPTAAPATNRGLDDLSLPRQSTVTRHIDEIAHQSNVVRDGVGRFSSPGCPAGLPGRWTEALGLFAHVLAAEHIWLARLQGREASRPVWPTLSIPECETLAAENAAGYAAYIDKQAEPDLAAVVRYRNSQGEEFTNIVLDILTHVVIHGAYHRGQIAKAIGRAGGKAVNTDYIIFARSVERSDA